MTLLVVPASKSVRPKALADLLWSTDPKLNSYMFGTMDVLHRIIETEWPAEMGLYSHKHAFTAVIQNNISGLLIGYTQEELSANFTFSVEFQGQALNESETEHLHSALHWMDRLFPTPRHGSYYILEFAVSPGMQDAGVATRLLEAARAQAVSKGCTQVCLDVAADNDAVGFYRHMGFRVEVETRIPFLDDRHGIGLHLQMVRDLE